MPRVITLVVALCFSGLPFLSGQAFAKVDYGENTGQKATGKPIPVGAITSMTAIGSFKQSDDGARAYFDCVNENGGIHGRRSHVATRTISRGREMPKTDKPNIFVIWGDDIGIEPGL